MPRDAGVLPGGEVAAVKEGRFYRFVAAMPDHPPVASLFR